MKDVLNVSHLKTHLRVDKPLSCKQEELGRATLGR